MAQGTLRGNRIDTLYASLVFLIFGLAAYLRFFNGNFDIYLDYDAPGYVLPALDYINNGSFNSYDGRAYPYPIFVLLVLSAFKSLKAVVVIQHIIGIAGGLAFVCLARQTGKAFKKSTGPYLFFAGISLLTLSLMLLNGNTILFEKSLRPEAFLMPFLNFMALFFIYLSRHKTSKIVLPLIVFMCFSGMLLWPRFMFSFIVFFVFSVCVFFRNHKFTKIWGYVFSTCILIVVFAAVRIPEYIFRKNSDGIYRYFAYQQLFYSNAHAVYKLMQKDNFPSGKYRHTDILVSNEIARTLSKGNSVSFPILHYDVDKLQYETAGPLVVQQMLATLDMSNIAGSKPTPPTLQDTLSMQNLLSRALHKYYKSWCLHLLKSSAPDLFFKSIRQFWFVSVHEKANPFSVEPVRVLHSGFIVAPHKKASMQLLGDFGFKSDQAIVLNSPKTLTKFNNTAGRFIRFSLLLLIPLFLFLLPRLKKKNFTLLMLFFYLAA